jgi:two-component system, NarL family, response regulator NreC
MSTADDEHENGSPQKDSPIQVVIVGGADMISEGLAFLIDREPDLTIVQESAEAVDAKQPAATADVIIVDADYPSAAPGERVAETRRTFPDARVLALSMVPDPANARFVVASGADAFMPKTMGSAELFQAIRELAHGDSAPDRTAKKDFAQENSAAAVGSLLSAKEERVLYLLALGNTNLEIARYNKVSLRTVETHRARICQKLGLRTRAELVHYARTVGLISGSTPE